MKEEITLKDIATLLNVSVSTVSRALKDHPRIGKKTKEAVLSLARDLDYSPNLLALQLLQKRSNTIGIIVPKISYHFYSLAISGVEEAAIKAGYNIMICQSNESFAREVTNTQDLTQSRVAGLIISQAGETEQYGHYQALLKKNIPVVFFNRVWEEQGVSKVVVDNYAAAYAAVEHLVAQGCRRIAFLAGPEGLHISNRRKEGYLAALAAHGLAVRPGYLVHNDYSEAEALQLTHRLLELPERPDAIFAISDRVAIMAMAAIKAKGLKIPADVALLGFNNDPVTALTCPAVTSVDQDAYLIGKTAAELLLRQLGEEVPAWQPETVTVSTRLVVRESTRRRG